MSNPLYHMAKPIVLGLVEEPPERWPDMIPRACGNDVQLCQYVSKWLAADPYIIEPPQFVKDHHIPRQ